MNGKNGTFFAVTLSTSSASARKFTSKAATREMHSPTDGTPHGESFLCCEHTYVAPGQPRRRRVFVNL